MFFSFLFIFGFPLPIERFPCGANINGYFFNITELANGRDFDIIRQNNKDNYYFKICGSLSKDDLPPLAPDSTDISVMRCNYSSHLCASAIPLQSFDWKLIHVDNPNDGVIYFASGEPFVDPEDKKYYTIDFEIELHCDKSDTKPNTNYTYLIINRTNEVAVKVIFYTSFGCPVPTSTPAPTPDFNPDCEFKFYLSQLTRYGVYTDFKQFNEGPYGIRVPLIIDENKKTLFYQPCERMLCPTNYTCTNNNLGFNTRNKKLNINYKNYINNELDGYSSAWLCDPTSRSCESYGLIEGSGIDAKTKSLFSESPIVITHHNKEKKRDIALEVSCNKKFEYDHFSFDESAKISNGKLKVLSSAHDSCYSFNPIPFPPFSGDTCFVDLNLFQDFNMSKFNNGTTDGYTATVNNGRFTLHYQPCGGMFCPSGAQCDGDINATVWLCTEQEDYLDCVAYGLLEQNLTYQEKFSAVDVTYKGDRKRMATVSFLCDEAVPPDQIKMPNKVELDGTRLHFNVHSGKLCKKAETQAAITGGAIFLIIVFVGIIIYLAVAMVVGYVRNGRLSPPNEKFWTEFFTCLAIGFWYLAKCGRIRTSGTITSKYDSI